MNEENKPLTAESVLQKHAQKYFNPTVKVVGKEFNPCDGDFILQKKEILPAMEEYAAALKEENESLKRQQSLMAAEVGKFAGMVSKLQEENERLKKVVDRVTEILSSPHYNDFISLHACLRYAIKSNEKGAEV